MRDATYFFRAGEQGRLWFKVDPKNCGHPTDYIAVTSWIELPRRVKKKLDEVSHGKPSVELDVYVMQDYDTVGPLVGRAWLVDGKQKFVRFWQEHQLEM